MVSPMVNEDEEYVMKMVLPDEAQFKLKEQ